MKKRAGLILLVALGLIFGMSVHRPAAPPAATPTPAAAVTATLAATPSPSPTPVPTSSPTPAPVRYVLSFVGDCTLATLHEWQTTRGSFPDLVDGDWNYPFANVRDYFLEDDLTLANLECAFTDRTAPVSKDYRFRATPAHAEILRAGGVEAVSLANNHSGDYGAEGYADTAAALADQGVSYTDGETPLLYDCGGLLVGILSFNTVEAFPPEAGWLAQGQAQVEELEAQGADLVVAFLHWGWEYRAEPDPWQVELAHGLVDAGADMVVGSHAHVLQRLEYYQDCPIFYSLGNFCFGGNTSPPDLDTVIVQQAVWVDAAGTVSLGALELVPCSISSQPGRTNFQPTPYAPDSEGYARVLEKLQIEPAA